ncbi:MAG: type VI secretion system baseplate subunit TssE [Deltaproteobacteria bacterium]|nr:type VI secretion system baseplate subunit TssE [Deltaproteobacteria bacterium]MBW2537818.1 type VI secretion system baseplate subunit TssE [Deltaproteobacteria bacterium]
MSGASLLDRLRRAADPHSSERAMYRGDDLESIVVEHLRRMLNTRQGSALTVPDYGILELSELSHDFPDALGIMQRAIKNSIVNYEPRLKNVQVRAVPAPGDMNQMFVHFEVTAQLLYPDGQRQAVRFTTAVDESSNVTVDI